MTQLELEKIYQIYFELIKDKNKSANMTQEEYYESKAKEAIIAYNALDQAVNIMKRDK